MNCGLRDRGAHLVADAVGQLLDLRHHAQLIVGQRLRIGAVNLRIQLRRSASPVLGVGNQRFLPFGVHACQPLGDQLTDCHGSPSRRGNPVCVCARYAATRLYGGSARATAAQKRQAETVTSASPQARDRTTGQEPDAAAAICPAGLSLPHRAVSSLAALCITFPMPSLPWHPAFGSLFVDLRLHLILHVMGQRLNLVGLPNHRHRKLSLFVLSTAAFRSLAIFSRSTHSIVDLLPRCRHPRRQAEEPARTPPVQPGCGLAAAGSPRGLPDSQRTSAPGAAAADGCSPA